MAALDTNVLIRHMVQDDPAQSAIASRIIGQRMEDGDTLFVPVTVSLELEWVLRSSFGFAKAQVIQTLSLLLSSAELSFESESALEHALVLYRSAPADYSDCVHVALASRAGERPLWTFDKAASRLDGADLLSERSW